ncbi:MAG: class I SAM-dependent methyltransferase [Pseudomonadota bacterium]
MVETVLVGAPEDLFVVSQKDRKGKPLRTVVNTRTGVVRNDPIPSEADLAAFYATDYRQDYRGSVKPKLRSMLRRLRWAHEFFGTHKDTIGSRRRLFDIGAGAGEFLFFAQKAGFETKGIEPDQAYAEFCRDAMGLDVETGTIGQTDVAQGSFDLITLVHVLEHLADPTAALRQIADWTSPDGLIYVEVPDIERMVRHHGSNGLFHFGHIWNFSPGTLQATAALAGLSPVWIGEGMRASAVGAFLKSDPDAHPVFDPAKAQTLKEDLVAAQGTRVTTGDVAKVFKKGARYLEETRATRGFSSPRDMAEHAVDRMLGSGLR